MSNIYDFSSGNQFIETEERIKRIKETDAALKKFFIRYIETRPNYVEEFAIVCVAIAASCCSQNGVSEEVFLNHARKVYKAVKK